IWPPGNRRSWGPCVLAQTQKAYEKGTRGISWGPLLTPGPRAVPDFPNGQSAHGLHCIFFTTGYFVVNNCSKEADDLSFFVFTISSEISYLSCCHCLVFLIFS
ncbi:unnamed protein product, partial [Staurois parvus]